MGTDDHPADEGGQPEPHPGPDGRTTIGQRPRPPWDRPEQRAALPELYDSLTLLPNRTLLIDRLSMALTRTHRTGEPIAVVHCSIDPLGELRAAEGNDVADKVLILVAKRLQRSVRTCDTVARADGDHFVLLLERLVDARDIHVVLDRVRLAMADPVVVDRGEHTLSPIMGAVITNDPMLEIDELFDEAERLRVEAEAAGGEASTFSDWTLRIFGDAAAALDSRTRTKRAGTDR